MQTNFRTDPMARGARRGNGWWAAGGGGGRHPGASLERLGLPGRAQDGLGTLGAQVRAVVG
uniref:hypothetical protein n=1 Tax=Nocardia cyriacigeorgica TaxID=135487 RepID=UPI002458B0D8